MVISQNVEKHPLNYAPVGSVLNAAAGTFFADAAAGTLPDVSFVDPEFGVTSEVGGDLNSYLLQNVPGIPGFLGANLSSAGRGRGDAAETCCTASTCS